jgi:hypothetical protein
MNPNKVKLISKNSVEFHRKVLNQHQTCFQKPNKVLNKRSQLSRMALFA